eukprot:3883946-Rhodomonas_salina.1
MFEDPPPFTGRELEVGARDRPARETTRESLGAQPREPLLGLSFAGKRLNTADKNREFCLSFHKCSLLLSKLIASSQGQWR